MAGCGVFTEATSQDRFPQVYRPTLYMGKGGLEGRWEEGERNDRKGRHQGTCFLPSFLSLSPFFQRYFFLEFPAPLPATVFGCRRYYCHRRCLPPPPPPCRPSSYPSLVDGGQEASGGGKETQSRVGEGTECFTWPRRIFQSCL